MSNEIGRIFQVIGDIKGTITLFSSKKTKFSKAPRSHIAVSDVTYGPLERDNQSETHSGMRQDYIYQTSIHPKIYLNTSKLHWDSVILTQLEIPSVQRQELMSQQNNI